MKSWFAGFTLIVAPCLVAGIFSSSSVIRPGVTLDSGLRTASDALRQGDLAGARRALAQAAPKSAQTPEFHELQGALLAGTGDLTGAEREFRSAIRLNAAPRAAHVMLAQVLFEKRKFAEAKPLFEQSVNVPELGTTVQVYLGRIASAEHRSKAAILHFEKASPVEDRLTMLGMLELASLYLGQGEGEKAANKLRLCTGECQKLPAYQLLQAQIEAAQGQIPAALDRLKTACAQSPEFPELWMASGVMSRNVKMYNEAEAAFARAATLKGQRDRAETEIALTQFERGDAAGAITRLASISGRKTSPEAAIVLARVLAQQHQTEKAEAALREAVRVFPGDADVNLSLGLLLWSRDMQNAGGPFFRKAVEIEPAKSQGWLHLSNLASSDHRMSEAEDLLKQGLKNSPRDPDLHFHLGLLYWHQNRWSLADQEFGEVLKLTPANLSAVNNRALLLVRQKKNLEEAEALAKRAMDGTPGNPQPAATYGWVLVARNKAREGLPFIEAAVRKADTNPELHYFYAVALSQTGKAKEANDEYQKAWRYGLPLDYAKQIEESSATGVLYRCAMDADVKSYVPGKCPRCGMTLVANLPPASVFPMAMKTVPEQIRAGEEVLLEFAISDPNTKGAAGSFQKIHEKLFHLFVVSADLTYFSHEHPELAENGKFRLRTRLPRDGRYRILADFYPSTGTPQLLTRDLVVGSAPRAKVSAKLSADLGSKKFGDLTVALKMDPAEPMADAPIRLHFDLAPADRLEMLLGAWSHMLLVSEDLKEMIHVHPSDFDGRTVTFALKAPQAGNYKLWAQFQSGGQVATSYFSFAVKKPARTRTLSE